MKNKFITLIMILSFCFTFLIGCRGEKPILPSNDPPASSPTQENSTTSSSDSSEETDITITKDGRYHSRDEVALYLHTYGKLPSNYITKHKAMNQGWIPEEGNLWEITEQMSIGGDIFRNRERKLPHAETRTWYECDIDYEGGKRGAKRIVYSSDGLIYYTADHYKTFIQLYPQQGE